MKRSTLEQQNTKNEQETLEQFPTFPTLQTGFDWEEDFKTFEKEADEFMKEAQSWTEETRREMMKMQEMYDFKTYYKDGWKITEVRDKARKSILLQKSKIEDGTSIQEIEYFQDGKRIYHSQKMEGIPKVSYSVTVEKSDGSCLILTLISLGVLIIIILVILGLIGLF